MKSGTSIGTSSAILCGVTIVENAIIGAGSLVTKDLPPDTVVAGVPAKIMRLSSKTDLEILFATIPVVLFGEGAY